MEREGEVEWSIWTAAPICKSEFCFGLSPSLSLSGPSAPPSLSAQKEHRITIPTHRARGQHGFDLARKNKEKKN